MDEKFDIRGIVSDMIANETSEVELELENNEFKITGTLTIDNIEVLK